MIRLVSHGCKKAFQEVPDLVYVKRHIQTGATSDDCWAWEIDQKTRLIGVHGQPIWKPKRRRKIGQQANWTVARLLVEEKNPDAPSKASYVNTCGSQVCVNPDHWRMARRKPRYVLFSTGEVWRAYTSTGRSLAQRARCLVRDAPGQHHFTTLPKNQFTQLFAECGSTMDPSTVAILPTDAVATCPACLSILANKP